MKINYRNTALWMLENPEQEEISIPEPHVPMTEDQKIKFGLSVVSAFKKDAMPFGENIRYVSHSFIEAFHKAKSKLSAVFDKENMEECGTLIWSIGSFTHTNFYYLKTTGIGEDWRYEIFFLQLSKHSKNDWWGLDVCVTDTKDRSKTFIWKEHFENGFDSIWYSSFLISFLLFIKYAEIETKVVDPGKKQKHNNNKYVNETKQRINILDSTWFTTIIRSDGFSVGADTGGFFRMQPCGPNNTQRKLIWVSPFEKQGYTRKAKISTI